MKKLLMVTTALCAFAAFDAQAQDVDGVRAEVREKVRVKDHRDVRPKVRPDEVRPDVRPNPQGDGHKFLKRFNNLDKDGDGALSLREMPENHKDKFERMDKNGDGKVTAREFKFAHDAHKGHHGKGHGKGGRFRVLDKNGDGYISRDEYPAKHADKFQRMDVDGDGKVSQREMMAAKKKMKEHRKNMGDKREDHRDAVQDRREDHREKLRDKREEHRKSTELQR